MGGLYNFKFSALVKDLRAQFGDSFNMVLPFTYVVPADSEQMINPNLTVLDGVQGISVLVRKGL